MNVQKSRQITISFNEAAIAQRLISVPAEYRKFSKEEPSVFDVFRLFNYVIGENMQISGRNIPEKEISNLLYLIKLYTIWYCDHETSVVKSIMADSGDKTKGKIYSILGKKTYCDQFREDCSVSFKTACEEMANQWYYGYFKKFDRDLKSFVNSSIFPYISYYRYHMIFEDNDLLKCLKSILCKIAQIDTKSQDSLYTIESLYTQIEGEDIPIDRTMDYFIQNHEKVNKLNDKIKKALSAKGSFSEITIHDLRKKIDFEKIKILRSMFKYKDKIKKEKELSIAMQRILSVALLDFPPWVSDIKDLLSMSVFDYDEGKSFAEKFLRSVDVKFANKSIPEKDLAEIKWYLASYCKDIEDALQKITEFSDKLKQEYEAFKENNKKFVDLYYDMGTSTPAMLSQFTKQNKNSIEKMISFKDKISKCNMASSDISAFLKEHKNTFIPYVEEFFSTDLSTDLDISQKNYIHNLLSKYIKSRNDSDSQSEKSKSSDLCRESADIDTLQEDYEYTDASTRDQPTSVNKPSRAGFTRYSIVFTGLCILSTLLIIGAVCFSYFSDITTLLG